MLLTDLAQYLSASIEANNSNLSDFTIQGVSALAEAQPGEISFLGSSAYLGLLQTTKASALISKQLQKDFAGPQLIHPNPHFAFAKAAMLFLKIDHGPIGIHPTAIIEEGVKIGKDVTIGAYSVVSSGTTLGDRVVLYPQVFLGKNVSIGSDTVIHSQTTVYFDTTIGERCLLHAGCVIGADGFGFAVHRGEVCKIPQVGKVRIESDVELGAHVTIDRATHGETLVKRFCKFDDKVHIGHNVEVGQACMFSAFSGVAGSTKIGDGVLMGGHSGISDHLHVVSGARIGAKTGVIENIESPGTFVGFPAEPASDWKRSVLYLRHIKKYVRHIANLEERLQGLEQLQMSRSAGEAEKS